MENLVTLALKSINNLEHFGEKIAFQDLLCLSNIGFMNDMYIILG